MVEVYTRGLEDIRKFVCVRESQGLCEKKRVTMIGILALCVGRGGRKGGEKGEKIQTLHLLPPP